MKENIAKWIVIVFFIFGCLFLTGLQLNANGIVSLKINDTYPGDNPDGFPSPGEKIALGITIVTDFIPLQSYIVCDTELVRIEKANTTFYTKRADTLINISFEPTLMIKDHCPTDTIIPFTLVNKNDTLIDTLSFNIHTVGVFDSCYLDKKVNKTSSELHIKVATKVTKEHSSGYSNILADISARDGELIKTVNLFDDGKHFDGDKNDGLFGQSWWLPPGLRDYVIGLTMTDSIMKHSFKMQRITGFTTKNFMLTHPYIIVGDPYSDSPENEVVDVIEELLDSLALGYDKWNIWFRGFPDSNEISLWGRKKSIVLWATRLGGTLKRSIKGKVLIKDFLAQGGNLFLATAYLGNYIRDYGSDVDSMFYKDIICSRFVKRFTSNDSIQTLVLRNPLTNQLKDTFNLSLSLTDSNGFASFTDIIKPIPPALPIVFIREKEDSMVSIDTSTCLGLKVKKNNYKIIYLCFNIDDISSFSVRKNFFEGSLNWLSQETADTFSRQPILEQKMILVKLSNPYPNPFLKESTVPFSLLSAAEVNLIVCDLAGRTVRSLIHSSLNKGNYYAVWDGKDEKGDETAAGYYFVRLGVKTVEESSGKEAEIFVSKKLLKLKK